MSELVLQSTATKAPAITDKTLFLLGVSGGKDSIDALIWLVFVSGISLKQIRAVFCNITNDHPWTIAHVKLVSESVHPIETIFPDWGDLDKEREGERLTFMDLAMHKRRFPSTKARFCTEFIKIYATQRYIQKLKYEGWNVISVSGVRADESEDRKDLPEWDYSGNLFCYLYRPLIRWTLKDVLAIHAKYNVPLNPLYSIGAQRVGCYPCIMSRKSEIRTIALRFPERIDEIRTAEQEFEKRFGRYSSFFPAASIPERFRTKPYTDAQGNQMMIATIDDVVNWSMSGKRAKGSYLDDEPVKEGIGCNSGYCE